MANIQFTQNQVDSLLQKLGSDDEFRALFQKNPAAALQQLPDPPKLPTELQPEGCLFPKSLASKEAIMRDRDSLRSRLSGATSLHPHLLES
jgi:putative modified peptide